MNNYLKYFVLLTVLSLFTIGLTIDYVTEEVDAMKSKGKKQPYGYETKNTVCGDRLCSEYPDGRTGYENGLPPITTPPVESPIEESPIEESPIEESPIEESPIEKITFKPSITPNSVLSLALANVPATIPLHLGYFDGQAVYFILTDSSDPKYAEMITKQQGWKVEVAPLLVNAPEESLSPVYTFTNGLNGSGVQGFQAEVFSVTPAQEDYNALTSNIHVMWNDGTTPYVLDSVHEIQFAEKNGMITLEEQDVVMNMPQIVWPEGQMKVKKDKVLTNDTPFVGGQILDINIDEMTVTFIAHRGWGPDGRTIYCIVTDATPSGPANMLGVTPVTGSASLITNPAAVDLFHFRNGISGPGPLGFQPGIAASSPDYANYSPMWRVFMIGWVDENYVSLLQTMEDIDFFRDAELIKVDIARPMDSDHIINCPIVDPFQ